MKALIIVAVVDLDQYLVDADSCVALDRRHSPVFGWARRALGLLRWLLP